MCCVGGHYTSTGVTASSSEYVGAPGAMMLFSLELIILDIEGGWYMGPLLPITFVEMVSGRRCGGVSRGEYISKGGYTDAVAVATVKAVAAAAENMEEGVEARVGMAPATYVEEP